MQQPGFPWSSQENRYNPLKTDFRLPRAAWSRARHRGGAEPAATGTLRGSAARKQAKEAAAGQVMCTGQAFTLTFPFIKARCQSAAVSDIRLKHISCLSTSCGEEQEACIPGGHQSGGVPLFCGCFFCCVPLQEKQISAGPDEWLQGLLHKGSGAVSCSQPR